jgi:hypothetical protein
LTATTFKKQIADVDYGGLRFDGSRAPARSVSARAYYE